MVFKASQQQRNPNQSLPSGDRPRRPLRFVFPNPSSNASPPPSTCADAEGAASGAFIKAGEKYLTKNFSKDAENISSQQNIFRGIIECNDDDWQPAITPLPTIRPRRPKLSRRQARSYNKDRLNYTFNDFDSSFYASAEQGTGTLLEHPSQNRAPFVKKNDLNVSVTSSMHNHIQHTVQPKIYDEVQHDVQPKIDDEVQHAVTPEIDDEVQHAVQPKIDDEVQHDVQPKIDDEVQHAVTPEIDDEVQHAVQPKIDDEVQHAVQPKIDDEVQHAVQPKIDDEVQHAVTPEIDDEVQHAVKPEMNTSTYKAAAKIHPIDQSKLGLAMYDSPVKDFSFQIEDEIIPIHKIVLAAHSSYFYQQFVESPGYTMDTVKVDEFDKEVVELVVKTCYDQPFDEATLETRIVNQLIKFANAYDIVCVLDLLPQSLSKRIITQENVCQLAVQSLETNDPDLYGKCVAFVADLFNKNQPIPDLSSLPMEFYREVILALSKK